MLKLIASYSYSQTVIGYLFIFINIDKTINVDID